MNKIPLFLIIILTIANCSSYQNNNQNKYTELESIAKSMYGPEFYFLFNSDSTYAICTNKKLTKSPSSFSFFVYDNYKNKSIFRENVRQGNLIWINDYQIKINWTPEIVKGDESKKENAYNYIYDIKLRRKISNIGEKLL